MHARLLLLSLLVAACAAPSAPTARPMKVDLGGSRIDVRFSDGARCMADVPMTGGEGAFGDCDKAWTWSVAIHHRNLLEPIFGAAVSPYATIRLTGPEGRSYLFQTPYVPEHGY